jgi:hypothetical protein
MKTAKAPRSRTIGGVEGEEGGAAEYVGDLNSDGPQLKALPEKRVQGSVPDPPRRCGAPGPLYASEPPQATTEPRREPRPTAAELVPGCPSIVAVVVGDVVLAAHGGGGGGGGGGLGRGARRAVRGGRRRRGGCHARSQRLRPQAHP